MSDFAILTPASTISLDGKAWRVATAPAAPDEPWTLKGHASTLYRLHGGGESAALKVMAVGSGAPGVSTLMSQLDSWSDLSGLAVAQRSVLDPDRCEELLGFPAGGACAVFMPWVDGPSWESVVLGRWELTPQQSVRLARGLAETLAALEARGLAHCQLSGHHLLLPLLAPHREATHPVALVDLEGRWDPLADTVPSGGLQADGYTHRAGPAWSPTADRFAGTVLMAEVLGWCDSVVREAGSGGAYFAPSDVGKDGQRYRLLVSRLRDRWGAEAATLLQDAWNSNDVSSCPPLSQWMRAVPDVYRPPARRQT